MTRPWSVALVALTACTSPPTEVVVMVEADAELMTRITHVEFAEGERRLDGRDMRASDWPLGIRLSASGTRSLELLIHARLADGSRLTQGVSVEFEVETRRWALVRLHAECATLSCGDGQVCACPGGACRCGVFAAPDEVGVCMSPCGCGVFPDGGECSSRDFAYDAGFDAGFDAGPLPEHCRDERTNEDESDLDCGGSCASCADDALCEGVDANCASGDCGLSGRCLPSSCANERQDLNETGLNCGGACDPCDVGFGCANDNDCASDVCQDGLCRVESCRNDARDGDETDVDCGGSCGACGVGRECAANADCAFPVCRGVGICRDGCFAAFGVDCDIVPTTYLKNVPGTDDRFGFAVDMEGELLVVGAPGEDGGANTIGGDQSSNAVDSAGAVYVYRGTPGAWSLEAYIKPSDNQAGRRFGSSVALSGDTLVVGAPGRDSDGGAAFVFRRAGDGTWTEEAALNFAGALEVNDDAGETVAVSGDWVAVGAPHRLAEMDTAANPGAVHLFRRSGGVWSRAVELIPPVDFQRGERFDHYQFGNAVAMEGDLLAVGARGDSSSALGVGGDPHNEDRFRSGAVYVYRREGASWVFEAYLKADLEGPGERFGHRLALDGESLLITAPRSRNLATEGTGGVGAMLNDSGLVFLFQRVDGEWGQVVRLKASNASIDDQFGVWAALEDGILTVGAAYEDGGGPLFGGDPTEEDVGQSGAVYVFAELPGVGWRQVLYIKAPVVDPDDQFGFSLALSGGRLAVGAPNEGSAVVEDSMDNTHEAAGAVWVYDFTRATDGEVCDGFDNDRDDSVDETFSECSSACVNGLCR